MNGPDGLCVQSSRSPAGKQSSTQLSPGQETQQTLSYIDGWKPEFLKQASLDASERATPLAVSMIPSLVYILGRIAKAQVEAYGAHISTDDTPDLEHVQKNASRARQD
ncbi:uncharacterized protein FOMMEDRAFT_162383 [Fomitiporia mediterranea MF3/22]|uniref:uncharacterized protein n=1 Tax=Fomitiporia mediterranea (strain MF3/22) TaxID=694068 RepID=UPI0004408936|nr:uncharacterized protein FOMMEDRAFT_162383 [Fomitiporia mediterranea MF3/22]EJC98036.1 hypothetical protein FOMMEDRAFT_162383 [Fomitiporia mediterranea MF3/22]